MRPGRTSDGRGDDGWVPASSAPLAGWPLPPAVLDALDAPGMRLSLGTEGALLTDIVMADPAALIRYVHLLRVGSPARPAAIAPPPELHLTLDVSDAPLGFGRDLRSFAVQRSSLQRVLGEEFLITTM